MKIDIGISEKERLEIAEGLKKLLADMYVLYIRIHGYHWNVTGPMFDSLHNMFMLHYTEIWNAVDLVAERIRALGYFAPATYAEFSKLTSIHEDSEIPKAKDMIHGAILGHEAVIRTARSIFPLAEKAGDQSTMDILTQRLQVHEKTAWMLRSLLD